MKSILAGHSGCLTTPLYIDMSWGQGFYPDNTLTQTQCFLWHTLQVGGTPHIHHLANEYHTCRSSPPSLWLHKSHCYGSRWHILLKKVNLKCLNLKVGLVYPQTYGCHRVLHPRRVCSSRWKAQLAQCLGWCSFHSHSLARLYMFHNQVLPYFWFYDWLVLIMSSLFIFKLHYSPR